MSHWWRAHDEAVDDPKLQLISDSLFRSWFNVMCLCSANDGFLPPVDQVAFKLRMTPAKASKVVDALVDVKLLDFVDGRFQPHNWNSRQFKSDVSTERVRRLRNDVKRFHETPKTVAQTVSETPPETDNRSSVPKGTGAKAPPVDQKTEFFRRGREVLGKDSGALLAKLLRSFGPEDDLRTIAKARARIEEASTKANPVEWLGRVMAPKPGEFKLMSGIEGVV